MHKEDRLLRVGVLGCGPIAQIAHFDAIRKARNAELYAICDAAPDLLDRMQAIHQPRVSYSDYDAMLADPMIEAVVVAVSDQFHIPLAMRAAAAGKHVFVEKPFGVMVEEVEAFRERLSGTGLVLQVGHNMRFDPGIMYAQQFVREEIGEVMAIKAWYLDSTYRYAMTDNVQAIIYQSGAAIKPAGNPRADRQRYFMLGHGSHLVDLTRFLGGEIVSVRAQLVEKFGSYCWLASVEFASGAVGQLDLTIAVRGDFEGGFRIYGENGSVNARSHLPWYHKSADVECFSTRDGRFHRPLGEDAYSYKRQIEGFADTILHGVPQHGANVDDGVASVRMMVALARSAETGTAVRLDEVTGAV